MPNLPLGNLVNYRGRSRIPNYVSGKRPITPPYPTGLLGWYKADIGVLKTGGAAATNGDVIETVNDQSGNGYNLVVHSGIPILTTNTNPGGLPSISLDGGAVMKNTSIGTAGNWTSNVGTEFVCYTPITTNYFVAQSGSAADGNWRYGPTGNSYIAEFRSARLTAYPTGTPYGKRIIYVIVSGAVNYFTRVNGTQAANQATAWAISGTLYIGGTSTGGNTLTGYLHEFMIYNAELSTSQITQNEAYLSAKWGV